MPLRGGTWAARMAAARSRDALWRDINFQFKREFSMAYPFFGEREWALQTLFDYLEGGDTLEDFLEGFPTVSRTLALGALEEAKQLLLASA